MLRQLLALSLIAVAFSQGTVTWGGLGVAWNIESPQVSFTVAMAQADLSKFDWWGFGFNKDGEDFNDAGTDFYMVYKDGTGTGRVVDSYLQDDDAGPLTDSDNNLSVTTHAIDSNGNFVTSFSRNLDTGDSNDFVLVEGEEIELFLRAGIVKDGVAQWTKDFYMTNFSVDFTNTYTKEKDYEEGDYSPALTYFTGLLALLLFVPY